MDELTRIRQEFRDFHDVVDSWRAVGEVVGKSGAYAYMVAAGKRDPSEDAIWEWIRNYRQQYAGKVSVQVCPTCGDAHVVGDCSGKAGQPIILAEDEEVRSVRVSTSRKRNPRTRREMTPGQAAVWDSLTTEERDRVLGL